MALIKVPTATTAIVADTSITKLTFLQKFTQEERIAIRASVDPIIVDFMDLLGMSLDVKLEHPDIIMGVNYLESIGLLAEGRAAEILTKEEGDLEWLNQK